MKLALPVHKQAIIHHLMNEDDDLKHAPTIPPSPLIYEHALHAIYVIHFLLLKNY